MNKKQSAAITTAGALLILFVTGQNALLGVSLAIAMLLAGAIYLLWKRRSMNPVRRHRLILAVVIAVAVAVGLVLALRVVTGEDSWTCANGQWVQHGHPSAPAPLTPCRN